MDKMSSGIIRFLQKEGYNPLTDMSSYIDLWKEWYSGKVDAFHKYTVFNGVEEIKRTKKTLGMAKTVCEDIANLLFNEKCGIAISDKKTDDYVKQVFDKNDIYIKINENQERKAAYGTVVYIPYWGENRIKFNFVLADRMFPLSWENGVINELCVFSFLKHGNDDFAFVQLFLLDKDANYIIENVLLMLDSQSDSFEKVSFKQIPGYESVKPKVLTKSQLKPFIVDRLNITNNIKNDSPLGIAIFANALDTNMHIDDVFDSYNNEFVLGKKRLMVAPEAMNIRTGQPVFDPKDVVYYQLPESITKEGTPFIKEIDFQLRAQDHEVALNSALNRFSVQCGLGESFYKFEGGTVTATQVISENSKAFRSVNKHEVILDAVLIDLIRLIVDVAARNGVKSLKKDADITVTFDDSIIEDKDVEVKRRMAEVSAGLLKPETYMAWRYGKTEEEVKEMMPDMPQKGNNEEGIQ